MLKWLILAALLLIGPAQAQMMGQFVCSSGCPSALGLNLQGPAYFSFEQTFINLFLFSSSWGCQSSCSGITFDASGYPEGIGGNSYIDSAYLYNYTFTGDYYLIKYTGDGVHPIADAGTITISCVAGSGTIVDSTPGRIVVHMPSAGGQGRVCITADDPLSTGNYIRNIAVIDCGTTGTPCANGNEAIYNSCPYINETCVNPVWSKTYGTRYAGGPGFTSYRFMDWMNTYNTETSFSSRSIPGWFSYADTNNELTGVPLEVIASVLNQTCADGWINVPGAGVFVDTDGTFTGVITGGSSSGTLTVTGLSGSILPRSTNHEGDYLSWSGGTQYGLYVTASLGGGQYTVAMPNGGAVTSQASVAMTASYVDTTYIQSMATVMQQNMVWCNPNQKLRVEVANEPWAFTVYAYTYFGNLGQSLWGEGGTFGGYNFRGMITAIAGNIFKATFGAQASHIESVVNIQAVTDTGYGMGNEGCSFASHNCYLIDTPYWAGGHAYANGIGAGAVANYYTLFSEWEPSDWLTLPDGGLSKLYLELTQGNQALGGVETMTQSGGTGYNISKTCNYIPLSGGSGAGALGEFITDASGVPTLQLSSSELSGSYNVGEKYAVNDTLTIGTNSCLGAGSGWSGTVTEAYATDPNATQSAINSAATLISTWHTFLGPATYNLKLYEYETGEQLFVQGGSDPMLPLLCAWDSFAPAQSFTNLFLAQWRAIVGTSAPIHYFTDTSSCGYPSSWGLGYTPQLAPTSPKYEGALQQLQFLLNRDLPGHPANDDRPVGLDMTG